MVNLIEFPMLYVSKPNQIQYAAINWFCLLWAIVRNKMNLKPEISPKKPKGSDHYGTDKIYILLICELVLIL